MGSGQTREIINTLERAVSNDFNRGWSFGAKDTHELVRNRNRFPRGDFYRNPGIDSVYTAAPVAADFLISQDCIYGLMVRPDNANFLIVDPGEAGFYVAAFPNSSTDDSDYIAIADAGLNDAAQLTFLANAGPGIRWDIIECQPTEILAAGGSSSRDIYNPATGQFTPTTVEKVRQGVLTYRVRRGTQGAGVPSPDPDWMPLAAVHVRTDSTSFLDSDVYDLRPLISERVDWSSTPQVAPPADGSAGYRAVLYEASFAASTAGGIVGFETQGYFRSHYGGYWSGGNIRKNVPANSAANFGATTVGGGNRDGFNWEDLLNQSGGGLTTVADGPINMIALFPRGYPRWVRYSQVALTPSGSNILHVSGRLPQGPRGILVANNTNQFISGLVKGTATLLPTHFGEVGGPALYGHVVLGALWDDSASGAYPAVGNSFDQKYSFPINTVVASLYTNLVPLNVCALASSLPTTSIWQLLGSFSEFAHKAPACARALLVRLVVNIHVTGNTAINFTGVFLGDGSPVSPAMQAPAVGGDIDSNVLGPGTAVGIIDQTFWIPLWPTAAFDEDTATRVTGISVQGTNNPSTNVDALDGTLQLLGYQF